MTAVDPEALGAGLRRLQRRSGAAGYRGCGVMLADESGELHHAVAHDETSRLLGEAQELLRTGRLPGECRRPAAPGSIF